MCGGVGRSEGRWAGAYREIIAAKAPCAIKLQPHIPQSCQLLGCSLFCWCTANLGDAASLGDEELRMHVKWQELVQTRGTITQGEHPVRA